MGYELAHKQIHKSKQQQTHVTGKWNTDKKVSSDTRILPLTSDQIRGTMHVRTEDQAIANHGGKGHQSSELGVYEVRNAQTFIENKEVQRGRSQTTRPRTNGETAPGRNMRSEQIVSYTGGSTKEKVRACDGLRREDHRNKYVTSKPSNISGYKKTKTETEQSNYFGINKKETNINNGDNWGHIGGQESQNRYNVGYSSQQERSEIQHTDPMRNLRSNVSATQTIGSGTRDYSEKQEGFQNMTIGVSQPSQQRTIHSTYEQTFGDMNQNNQNNQMTNVHRNVKETQQFGYISRDYQSTEDTNNEYSNIGMSIGVSQPTNQQTFHGIFDMSGNTQIDNTIHTNISCDKREATQLGTMTKDIQGTGAEQILLPINGPQQERQFVLVDYDAPQSNNNRVITLNDKSQTERNIGNTKRQIVINNNDNPAQHSLRGASDQNMWKTTTNVNNTKRQIILNESLPTQTTQRSTTGKETHVNPGGYVGPNGPVCVDMKTFKTNNRRSDIVEASSQFGPTVQGLKQPAHIEQIGLIDSTDRHDKTNARVLIPQTPRTTSHM